MPRDEWARARARDAARRGEKDKRQKRAKIQQRTKTYRRRSPSSRVPFVRAQLTPESRLGFGSYGNMPISQVPLHYLRWIGEKMRPRNYDQAVVLNFVREYISRSCSGNNTGKSLPDCDRLNDDRAAEAERITRSTDSAVG